MVKLSPMPRDLLEGSLVRLAVPDVKLVTNILNIFFVAAIGLWIFGMTCVEVCLKHLFSRETLKIGRFIIL